MSLLYDDIPGAVQLLIIHNSGGYRWEEKGFLPRVVMCRRQGSLLFVPLCEKEMIECVCLDFIFRWM